MPQELQGEEVGLKFSDFGFNYRMTEIQALMGWKQLKIIDQVVKREIIKMTYAKELTKFGFFAQHIDENET